MKTKIEVASDIRAFIAKTYAETHSARKTHKRLKETFGRGMHIEALLDIVRAEGVEVRPQCRGDGSGLCVDPRGYVRVYLGRGHERANASGLAFQHVLVAEEALGRRLRKGEIVHHRNGKKGDNWDENLMVITRPVHDWIHSVINGVEQDIRREYERISGTPLPSDVSFFMLWEGFHVLYIDPVIEAVRSETLTSNDDASNLHEETSEK